MLKHDTQAQIPVDLPVVGIGPAHQADVIISKPASKVSTKVVSASVKEAELNSAKRFESYMVR